MSDMKMGMDSQNIFIWTDHWPAELLIARNVFPVKIKGREPFPSGDT